MSVQFTTLKVKAIQKETADCVSVVLEVPENLANQFKYTAGQHITLKTTLQQQEVRRNYSLCSSPLENEWRIAIKQVEGGVFSTWANTHLQVGDALEVLPPAGRFTLQATQANFKQYVFFAAGSGITPIFSIIKTLLQTVPHAGITLVYGNKNRQNIIFKEQLEALKNKYMQRLNIIHILSRERTDAELNFGRIDAEKCQLLFAKNISLQADGFFICGPQEMTFNITAYLEQNGVPKDKIHFELFASGTVQSKTKTSAANASGPVSKITVKVDGRSFDFNLGFNGDNILDAALKQGADLPYACKGGVCCTCKAKLIEGEVEMEVNWGLEHDEMAQGYILTCQSHPVTDRIVVDYDV
jgi:ring-1,2-phenylacetyl-CoA epoxidase subunit PaaE